MTSDIKEAGHTPFKIAYKKWASYYKIYDLPQELTVGRVEEEKHARFIVCAVNSHADLVRELSNLIYVCENNCEFNGEDLEDAKAALAKAGVQS